MTGNDNFSIGEVIASETTMKSQKSMENTWGGKRLEFLGCGEVRITMATKHFKVGVIGVAFV